MEIELRAPIKDPSCIIDKIKKKGFIEQVKFDQTDIILDQPNASFFRSGEKIRIRIEGNRAELTYKGKFKGDDKASRREELNIQINRDDVTKYIKLFEAIGFPVCFQIDKSRCLFKKDNIKITFDYWPIIGCLMEIEGDEKDAKKIAYEIAPNVQFKNYRLKELFTIAEKTSGKSLEQLKINYENKTGKKLGRIELILK